MLHWPEILIPNVCFVNGYRTSFCHCRYCTRSSYQTQCYSNLPNAFQLLVLCKCCPSMFGILGTGNGGKHYFLCPGKLNPLVLLWPRIIRQNHQIENSSRGRAVWPCSSCALYKRPSVEVFKPRPSFTQQDVPWVEETRNKVVKIYARLWLEEKKGKEGER